MGGKSLVQPRKILWELNRRTGRLVSEILDALSEKEKASRCAGYSETLNLTILLQQGFQFCYKTLLSINTKDITVP